MTKKYSTLLYLFFFSAGFLICNKNALGQTVNDTLYSSVEVMPEFPGGEVALHKFIKDKLPFANHRCSGKVIVSFVIDQKGDMEPPRVLKGLDVYCDYQAVWIVSIMPHWKPGMHNNKPVRVKQEIELPFNH